MIAINEHGTLRLEPVEEPGLDVMNLFDIDWRDVARDIYGLPAVGETALIPDAETDE